MESKESVWKLLRKCGVCGKEMSDTEKSPQLMPCCHSACKECIDDELQAIQDMIHTNSNNNHNKEESLSKCKICSQEYSPSECIENTFQILHWAKNPTNNSENSEKICQSCEGQNKSAVIQCQTCDWICSECLELHEKLRILKGHHIDQNTKIEKSLPNNMCSEHNEQITVYCKTCKTAYCTRCILKDHNLHVYEDTKDSDQLKQFYDNFNRQVEQIKEKRSFTTDTLEKFETIESDVSDQKNKCIEKIKSITDRLHEKIAELGKSMLDKVNGVCQLKETEFSAKKTELNQLNNSFKYIEEFMSAIMELNDPMGVMKAQDLLNNQLEKLLNKPCSHPDFIKPFKIDVIDSLEDVNKTFSVGKMIYGVFNMCFKLRTSDDPIEKTIEVNDSKNETNDEDIEIIATTNSNSVQTSSLTHNNSRGNRESQKFNNPNVLRKTKQSNSYASNYNLNNFQNPNNTALRSEAIPTTQMPTQRLQNSSSHSMHLQSLNTLTNSVPRSMHSMQQMPNHFTQTGMPSISSIPHNPNAVVTTSVSQMPYGCPQVYRGPVNQLNQNSVLITTPSNQQNNYLNLVRFSNPPNVTPFAPNSIRIQQIPQQQNFQQTHQSIQQTPFNQNVRTLAGGCITASVPQSVPSYPSIAPRQQQNQNMTHSTHSNQNQQILFQLSAPPIHQMRPPLQTPINRVANTLPNNAQQIATNIINSTRSANITGNVNNTQMQTTRNNSSQDQTPYELHIPEQPIVRSASLPAQELTENTGQTTLSKSLESRRNSAQTFVSHSITQNETNNESVVRIQSQSTGSTAGTSPQPMPNILPIDDVSSKEMPQNNEPIDNSTNDNENASNLSSVDSLISTSNTNNSIESVNNNNKDENKENKEVSTCSRSTAPVARIAPITPEIDPTADDLEEQIDEEADCVVCLKEYGEFIICERCPRAFHIKCHVPELKTTPDSAFICTFCQPIPTLQINGRTKNRLGLNERQQAICERVLIGLLCHKKSQDFRPPYSENISKNLDLITIKTNLENNIYKDEIDFVSDIERVIITYKSHSANTDVQNNDYKTFDDFFSKLMKEFMPGVNRNGRNRDSTTSSTAKRTRLA